jgi:murein DD-endopeptidase MepM/ murein hydrolase activator NlpD
VAGLIDALDKSISRYERRFADLLPESGSGGGLDFQALAQQGPAAGRDWSAMLGGNGGGLDWGGLARQSAGLDWGSLLGGGNQQSGVGWRDLARGLSGSAFDRYDQLAGQRQAKDDAARGAATTGQNVTETTGTSTGMTPGVAKWAGQAQQTFAGIVDPDVMLAIMTNESGGDPNAYNAAGDAWGLFQNVGLKSNDPNAQFAAAKTLVQQKLASIAQSYAANGLNPDERTRARDVALAWAGHFSYATGRPNPTSRDIGSNQTADQLSAIFLKNYDAIKAGRTAAPATGTGGGTGMASIWGGANAPITQPFGDTEYSANHSDTYDYGGVYGVHGHTGADVGVARGTRLYSPVAGTVQIAGGSGYFRDEDYGDPGNQAGRGELRIVMDDGTIVILGHNSAINARVGQRVNAGDFVASSGSANGPHTHIEVRVRDASLPSGYRIVNPSDFFAAAPPGGGTGRQ